MKIPVDLIKLDKLAMELISLRGRSKHEIGFDLIDVITEARTEDINKNFENIKKILNTGRKI